MQKKLSQAHATQIAPRYLWFFTLSYSMVMVLANWFDPRFVSLYGMTTDAGTLIFPLTFLLSDLITEVYGYKYARLAIWCGFLFNLLFILYGQLVIHLPSPDFPTHNALFDTLLSINIRIIVSSCISYLTAEPLNSFILSKLKIKMHGRYLSIRFVLSTIFASAVDSMLFGWLAFYNTLSLENLFSLIFNMWLIKVLVEILLLPISISLVKTLKRAEELDIYDRNTIFSLFNLDTQYSQKDNEYQPMNSIHSQ